MLNQKNITSILFVDDIVSDVDAAVESIKNEGFDIHVERVETEEAMETALVQGDPDIVIASATVENADILRCLAIAKSIRPLVPIIVCSTSMDVDGAVLCMRNGAFDYVAKEQLARLPFSVRSALENATLHTAQTKSIRKLRESERNFYKTFHSSTIAMAITTANGRFVDVNLALAELLSYDPKEMIGRTISALRIYEDAEMERTLLHSLLMHGRLENMEASVKTNTGEIRYILFSMASIDLETVPHFLLLATDITKRKTSEMQLKKLNRLYRVLSSINQLIVRERDISTILIKACRIAVEEAGFRMVWIGKLEPDTQDVRVVAHNGLSGDYLQKLHISLKDATRGSGPTGRSIRTGKHFIVHDIENDPAMEPWRADALRIGYRSSGAFPLIIGTSVWGTLNIYSEEPGFFTTEEIALLEELATDIAFALEIAEKEQKREMMEKLIRESEARYKLLFQSNPHPMWVYDVDSLSFLAVNDAAVNHYGYSRQEFLSMKITNLRPESEVPKLLENIRKNTSIVQYSGVWCHRKKNETLIEVEILSHAITFDGKKARIVHAHDVTETRKAHAALRESEERQRLALSSANQGMFDLNIQTGVAIVSPEYASMLGYTTDELEETNQKWRERLHPQDFEKTTRAFEEYLTGIHQDYNIEYRQRTKMGEWKWILSTGKIVERDREGKPLRMLGTHTDISNLKRTEKALRESEAKYQELFELGFEAIFLIENKQGRILEANAAASEMYGYSHAELLKLKNRDLSAEPEQTTQVTQETPVGSVVVPLRYHRKKDGSVFPVEINGRFFEWNGCPVHVAAIRDLTKRWQMQEELKESERRLRKMMENVRMIAVMLDTEEKITFANQYLLQLTGWSEAEVIGKQWYDIFLSNGSEVRSMFGEFLAHGAIPEQHENQILTRSGERRLISWSNSVLFDIQGNLIGTSSLGVDITEQRTAEEKIRKLNAELELRVEQRTAQLELSNRELEAFAYSVSHDLRAPLRSIEGFSTILLEEYADGMDELEKKYFAAIQSNAMKMDHLIWDMMQLARVARADINFIKLEMSVVVQSVCKELSTPDVKTRCIFEIAELPTAVGDHTLLRQVWLNLLSNAIKYTSKVSEPRIEIGGRDLGDVTLFYVRDNGVGFDQTFADKMFGVFQRLHSEKEFEGSGVGLAIVQRIIHRHGGRVQAEGTVGKGATFSFTLPKHHQS